MYRIGQFSKIGKVTVKALRFYEKEGLLEPDRVDAITGYRYYDSSRLPRLHKIVALKQCGFSIDEIRAVLAGRDLSTLFARRKAELEKTREEVQGKLSAIASYIASMTERESMDHQVLIKSLPKVLVYSKRMIVESYDSYFLEIPRIGEEVCAANPKLRCFDDPPYCFIVYHDGEYKDRDIDVEYCEAVYERGVDTDTIKFKVVEAVPQAACVLHQGSYAELRAAYSAAFRWIDDNGYVPTGNPRESYIDGIWNRSDPAEWLTEVQVPCSKPLQQ